MGIFRYRNFSVTQEHAAMKVGTDSDLLGTLGAGGGKMLDIGTGTGVLSLMMAQRYPDAQITAIEIDENAVLDAKANFENSIFKDRIALQHISFQDYLAKTHELFNSIICNPPYFDKSLECDNLGRTRARHSSSLPFDTLARGAYQLLKEGGTFSVCIPPEVFESFNAECLFASFSPMINYQIKSVPDKGVKRLVLVYAKGPVNNPQTLTYCMRNQDRTRSEWYKDLMHDFLITTSNV